MQTLELKLLSIVAGRKNNQVIWLRVANDYCQIQDFFKSEQKLGMNSLQGMA